MYSDFFDKAFVFGLGGIAGSIILGVLSLFMNTLLPYALVMFMVFGAVATLSWLIDAILYLMK